MIAQQSLHRTTIYAWLAAALALIHIALAIQYARATPYRSAGVLLGQRDPATGLPAQVPDIGAPDERQHANYIAHLMAGRGFPVLVWEVPHPSEPGRTMRNPHLIESYQAHQPPLYYLLAAGFARVVGADPVSPQTGSRIRILNALLGAGTVLSVYFLALWSFRRQAIALVAGALAALLPMHVALSGAISNDPLLFLLCTLSLAVCVKGARDGWSWSMALGAGALVGLGLLTKTTAIALLPILLLAMLVWGAGKDRLWKFLLAGGTAIALVAPWWLRNHQLYGDPLALRAFNEAFVGSPQARAFIDAVGMAEYMRDWVGWWTARSFFGVFGYMDIFLNERGTPATGPGAPNTLYRLLLAGAALALLGFVLGFKEKEWRAWKPALWLNGIFLLLILILFLRFNLQYFQGQARYLYPAIGPICAVFAVGLLKVAGGRARLAFGVACGALLALNFYALSRLPGEFSKRALQPNANLSGSFEAPKLGATSAE